MGFNNPGVPWSEIERTLSDRRLPNGRADNVPPKADGGDSPAWSRKRMPFETTVARRTAEVAYAELHCHTNFSFLDGASHPEELAEEAARLGLEALAVTDHDNFAGVVRFAEAAREVGIPTVFGAELSLGLTRPQNGIADPEGSHLLVLARGPEGYARLADALSRGLLRGRQKGKPVYEWADLADGHGGHWQVLTGCRKGAVPKALVDHGPAAARRELDLLIDTFGREQVVVELWDHGAPLDSARNDALAELAARAGVDVIATNNVHYATPARRRLATAIAAVRSRRSLDDIEGWLPAASTAHLRSGAEQARRFARYPGVIERAAELGGELAFDLKLIAPSLPPFPCPDGLDEMGYLRWLVAEGATRRYGTRDRERIPGAWEQLAHELDLIESLGFAGYFLVVWDLVDFCRHADIYCQGRGSAANSAVCYALGITNADAVALGLLFERFLSPERDGPPDIDIDIESNRREEVIQYVYEKHGRRHAAQVANVITYRAKSAIRDMAKALGYATGQQDAWSRNLDRWSGLDEQGSSAGEKRQRPADQGDAAKQVDRSSTDLNSHSTGDISEIPDDVLDLARQVEHFPRHLGVHSGGMVMCDRPIVEVCPVEWSSFTGRPNASLKSFDGQPIRSVLQWDKDDCAAAGLVKFDLLGLGMLTVLHEAIDFVADVHGADVDLAAMPQDDEVYDMLCRADTIGVFQIESRAQMATLPRLKPRSFYDLVVEVALIRPGPIQGGSVHPYIRRRNGLEEITYLHPLLENALSKTLGIPLFQEQLMQMAIDVAGFTPAEADQLRQAMGSKRSRERMERIQARLYDGMAERGITGETADVIWTKLAAFANYGFPESHSVSFAHLVYASSWLKRFYPAAFCAALLNAQPMGFYSTHSLVQDARRHGVEVRTPDLNASAAEAVLEADVPDLDLGPAARGSDPVTWGVGQPAVRLGVGEVRGISDDQAVRIAEGRPYVSMEDLHRRAGLTLPQLEAMATAGAFGCFGLERREAIWQAGAVAQSGADRLEGIVTGAVAPTLPGMEPPEQARADLWSTGVSPDGHPTKFLRDDLTRMGVVPASGLAAHDQPKVLVAGIVTHRQRPATAGGTLFMNLEDETGLINIVVSKGCWKHHARVARQAPALLIRGRVEKSEGVINVVAETMEPLRVQAHTKSRDFR
ncbi:MAG TPA: error-prone DNA polymerase [Acidimicrobiales bacterium]|nr:error-prone DNA polymerase [Acidimicrobiales bacterium]